MAHPAVWAGAMVVCDSFLPVLPLSIPWVYDVGGGKRPDHFHEGSSSQAEHLKLSTGFLAKNKITEGKNNSNIEYPGAL